MYVKNSSKNLEEAGHMEEKPMDRRVRKTKRQLRLALMQLMSEKA